MVAGFTRGFDTARAEAPRRRVYGDDEMAALFAALVEDGSAGAQAILLAMFTGCRIGEATAARWADFDWTPGMWRKPTTKGGRPHEVPLHEEALRHLRGIGGTVRNSVCWRA